MSFDKEDGLGLDIILLEERDVQSFCWKSVVLVIDLDHMEINVLKNKTIKIHFLGKM